MEPNTECAYCKIKFYRSNGRTNENKKTGAKNSYCSIQCVGLAKSTAVVLPCLFCGLETKRSQTEYKKSNKIFCSHSCAAKYNNPLKIKHKKLNIVLIDKLCLQCQNPIPKGNSKFCSIQCRHDNMRQSIMNKIMAGENIEPSKDGNLNPTYRNYLIKKSNNQCSQCGWNKLNIYSNKIPLEIHHIDGDYRNNLESNLQVLCPNCHALTPNFRSRNRENIVRQKGIRRKQYD